MTKFQIHVIIRHSAIAAVGSLGITFRCDFATVCRNVQSIAMAAIAIALPAILMILEHLPVLLDLVERILVALGKALKWIGQKIYDGLRWAGKQVKEAWGWLTSWFRSNKPDSQDRTEDLQLPEFRLGRNFESRLQSGKDKMLQQEAALKKITEKTQNYVNDLHELTSVLDPDVPGQAELRSLANRAQGSVASMRHD